MKITEVFHFRRSETPPKKDEPETHGLDHEQQVAAARAEQEAAEHARIELIILTEQVRTGATELSDSVLRTLEDDTTLLLHTNIVNPHVAADALAETAYNLGAVGATKEGIGRAIAEQAIACVRAAYPAEVDSKAVGAANDLEVAATSWVIEHPDPSLPYPAALQIAESRYKEAHDWHPEKHLRAAEHTGEFDPFADDED